MLEKLRSLIATVAPTIATALGGPLAGVAVGAVSDAVLGRADGTEAEVAAALARADPAVLERLKAAEQDFAIKMRRLDVEVDRIDAADRADARARHTATKDPATPALAFLITVGFFGTLAYAMIHGLPESGREAMLVLLGALGAAWAAVVNYYFGTSNGARRTSDAINEGLRR
jgi:hypothetical protein